MAAVFGVIAICVKLRFAATEVARAISKISVKIGAIFGPISFLLP